MVMTTHTLPSTLDYVDSAVRTYYQEEAGNYKPVYNRVFDEMSTDKAWVQDISMAGLGPLKQSAEGQAVEFDSLYEGAPATYVLSKYHIGFGLTEDAKIFNKMWPLLENGTKSIAVSVKHTMEMVCADLLNKAFLTAANGGYTGADGLAMCDSSHPLIRPDAALVSGSGTYRNRPAVDYGISEVGLEQACIDIANMTDESGFYGSVEPETLFIREEQRFNVTRVLKSLGRVGTNDNDPNALKMLGILQKDPVVWNYLTSTSAFFIKTRGYAGPGLKVYKHSAVDATPVVWIDNATGNTYVRSRMFMAPGWTNPRAVYASPGTAS